MSNREELQKMLLESAESNAGGKDYDLTEGNLASLSDDTIHNLWRSVYEDANIPRRFHNMTLDDWRVSVDAHGNKIIGKKKLKKEHARYLADTIISNYPKIAKGYETIEIRTREGVLKTNHFVFAGGSDTGKSLLAASIAKCVLNQGYKAWYQQWTDLLSTFSFFDDKESQREISHQFKASSLIVIDGVTAEYAMNAMCKRETDRLMNYRLQNALPTIICAPADFMNVDMGQIFKEMINESFVMTLPSPR